MKHNLQIVYLLLVGMLTFLTDCRKDNGLEKLPDLRIIPKPAKGLTTDVFDLSVDPVTAVSVSRTLFYRWDWDNDGTWDTQFSTNNQLKHRFLHPGNQIISIEYSDGKKQVRAETLTIVVEQGYSAPHPAFKVNPVRGNILTTFTFDAGLTKDDEDSLDQLKFRWDFRGDGRWTSEYSKNPVSTFQYTSAGVFNPKLEARDPSSRSATYSGELTVSMEDSLIIADFSINETLIRLGDTVILDASASHHAKDTRRELLFSWYLPDRAEWTIPDGEKMRSLIINQQGQFTVRLKVLDKETKLFNQVAKEFFAADQNLPPKAKIQVGSVYGNTLTQFYFDSWSSTDDYQAPSELDVRWDFDGDGAWDTPFSREKVSYHQFEMPGDYNVTLLVRDSQRLTSIDRKLIHVSANANETSFFKDHRDGTFYGTVKVGNQWWMSQNLNFIIPQKQVEGVLQWLCLFEQSKWCDQVGKLYRIGAVVENRSDNEYVTICPTGWRLPSKEDWETLFTSIGGEQNAKELRYGGKSDFNALDLGYGDYYFVYAPGNPYIPIDTIFEFHETYQKSWFLSTSEPYDPNHARVDIWQWGIDRAGNLWTGYNLTTLYMPVRCVKEE